MHLHRSPFIKAWPMPFMYSIALVTAYYLTGFCVVSLLPAQTIGNKSGIRYSSLIYSSSGENHNAIFSNEFASSGILRNLIPFIFLMSHLNEYWRKNVRIINGSLWEGSDLIFLPLEFIQQKIKEMILIILMQVLCIVYEDRSMISIHWSL